MTLRVLPGRLLAVLSLVAWASVAIVKASLQVARDIVAPSARVAPVVLVVPLRARTGIETATVSGLLTLTPGTLTVGIESSPSSPPALWVHGMYGADPEALRAEVRAMEHRVLRALRYPQPIEEDP
jgi:multicomponent Na+:H+ antiporter subunit E